MAAIAVLCSVACGHPGNSAAGERSEVPTQANHSSKLAQHYPGTLRSPTELGDDFQWRQRVIARWPEGSSVFDAVLTKTGAELVLLGLGPMDTPGFILTLGANGEMTVENHTGRPIPFDARYVLLDVQRTFFPWFSSPFTEGSRTALVDGERVTEEWQQGNLMRRSFSRVDDNPPGEITVTYADWVPGKRAPTWARLENGWFGYVLEIETVDQATL